MKLRKLSYSLDIYYSLKIRSFTSVLLVHSFINGFVASKETVVLLRWGRSKLKFGFIKQVDKG